MPIPVPTLLRAQPQDNRDDRRPRVLGSIGATTILTRVLPHEGMLPVGQGNCRQPVMTPLRQRMLDALVVRGMAARTQESAEESWPNWPYYVRTSDKIQTLWQQANQIGGVLS